MPAFVNISPVIVPLGCYAPVDGSAEYVLVLAHDVPEGCVKPVSRMLAFKCHVESLCQPVLRKEGAE